MAPRSGLLRSDIGYNRVVKKNLDPWKLKTTAQFTFICKPNEVEWFISFTFQLSEQQNS